MITISFFTSGKHTRPVIKTLEQAKTVKLLNIYSKLPRNKSLLRGGPQGLLGGGTMADLFLVADFGQIIPPEVFKMPKYNTLCLHPSLLPKYRGASPAAYAMMNGDKITGATIFELDEKIDHGSIIAQFKEPIRPDDTQESLLERLFQKGAARLVEILPDYVKGRIKPRSQDHTKATYAKRLTRQDGRIDWRKSDAEIERFIRAMTPWPSAWTTIKSKRLKILKAHLSIPDRPLKPIVDRENLVIEKVQLESKKPITWHQFQAGYPEIRFN